MATHRSHHSSSQNTSSSPQQTDDEIDLTQLLGILWFHKWRIVLITLVSTMLGAMYAYSTTPVYQANSMVEFANSKNQVLGDLSDLMGGTTRTPADAEVDMIKSRRILGKTVQDLNLHIQAVPMQSRWQKLREKLTVSSHHDTENIQPNIKVAHFRLPEKWLDTPFQLTILTANEYVLHTPDQRTLIGKVGKPLTIGKDSELLVQSINAPTNQTFTLTHNAPLTAIGQIASQLSVSPKAKNSPMIGLSLSGTDPQKIKQILDRIMENYADESRNKDIQAASSGLRFIEEELPRMQHNLQEAENALNQYRAKSRSMDIPSEAKGVLESLNKIEMQLVDLRTEQAVLNEVYTKEHPSQQALNDKIRVLNEAKSKLNTQITQLPAVQQEIIRLTRNVEINQGIYVQLLNKQQELNILKASSQGNVRIIDMAAVPKLPIKPKKLIIITLSSIVGVFFGILWYFLKTFLTRGIHHVDEIEALGLEVIISIPKSDSQSKRDRLLKKFGKKKHVRSNTMLALKDPTDMAVEALRALRTNLFFRSLNQQNNHNVIMISGATPEVGKSFVSANLAVLMSQSNKKVLLIDGDMRKGYMHHLLNVPSGEGLSETLSCDGAFHEHIWKTNLSGLHFLGGGATPKSPAELLLNGRMKQFLAWASEHYDFVILDTPPVLAVTDAAIMGQYASITLLVSRFGQTTWRELEACVGRFTSGNVAVSGIVLNGVERTANNYYSYDSYSDKYGRYGKK